MSEWCFGGFENHEAGAFTNYQRGSVVEGIVSFRAAKRLKS
jgi:hypothetical protein